MYLRSQAQTRVSINPQPVTTLILSTPHCPHVFPDDTVEAQALNSSTGQGIRPSPQNCVTACVTMCSLNVVTQKKASCIDENQSYHTTRRCQVTPLSCFIQTAVIITTTHMRTPSSRHQRQQYMHHIFRAPTRHASTSTKHA